MLLHFGEALVKQKSKSLHVLHFPKKARFCSSNNDSTSKYLCHHNYIFKNNAASLQVCSNSIYAIKCWDVILQLWVKCAQWVDTILTAMKKCQRICSFVLQQSFHSARLHL